MVALSEVAVDIVASGDEARFRDLMEAHHYLGALPGMGETVRYVAHHRGLWLALLVFSAPALKCRARDRWIGWDFGVQFNRLHLVTNNSRFLILPGGPRNLGSRVLSLCKRRLARDWPARFGHSKDKRTDCPLLTLGLVLDASGFVRRSQVFAGNVREHHTLAEMLDVLDAPHDALVVMPPRTACGGCASRATAIWWSPAERSPAR